METKGVIQYSVIVPVYNGALSLPELCEKILSALQNFAIEIILVDDASKDESWHVIQQLKNVFPCILPLRHTENKGQSAGVLTGFGSSKGHSIITIDDDLQFDPFNILDLLEKQKLTGADIVYGLPQKPQHSLVRNSSSKIFKKLGSYAGYEFKGSSFRLMRKEVMEKLAMQISQKNVLIDPAFYRAGYHMEFIEVPHYKRRYGKSNYTFFKLLRLLLNSASEHVRTVFLKRQHK